MAEEAPILNDEQAKILDEFVEYLSQFDFVSIDTVTSMLDQYYAQWRKTQSNLDYLKFNSVCMRCAPMLNEYVKYNQSVLESIANGQR